MIKSLFVFIRSAGLNPCSFNYEATEWNATRSEVSKISIMILMMRCEYIVKRFLADEIDLGVYTIY